MVMDMGMVMGMVCPSLQSTIYVYTLYGICGIYGISFSCCCKWSAKSASVKHRSCNSNISSFFILCKHFIWVPFFYQQHCCYCCCCVCLIFFLFYLVLFGAAAALCRILLRTGLTHLHGRGCGDRGDAEMPPFNPLSSFSSRQKQQNRTNRKWNNVQRLHICTRTHTHTHLSVLKGNRKREKKVK